MNIHTYANDTQIYISFKPDDSVLTLQQLELCISKIRLWMIENKLKLNDDKSEFILISSPHNKKKFDGHDALSLSIGNTIFEPKIKFITDQLQDNITLLAGQLQNWKTQKVVIVNRTLKIVNKELNQESFLHPKYHKT